MNSVGDVGWVLVKKTDFVHQGNGYEWLRGFILSS